MLITIGPTTGIWVNIAFYLPLTLFLLRTRFTGRGRSGGVLHQRVGAWGALRVMRAVAEDRTLVSMIVLAGLASFFVGSSLQSVMPAFADGFGGPHASSTYELLLSAQAAGAVGGGLVLEVTGWLRPNVRVAVVATIRKGRSHRLIIPGCVGS